MLLDRLVSVLSLVAIAQAAAVGQLPLIARETIEEAAVHAKQLVHSSVTGTLASVFPANSTLAGRPHTILEYHAPCHHSPSLTFLLFPISLSTKNIFGAEGHYAGYTVSDPIDGVRSPMSRGRVAFTGNMTLLPDLSAKERARLSVCYKSYHPDVFWFPPASPGESHHPFDSVWARFDPEDIYYVGGFGDTHYIGHIPVEMYAEAGEK
ncbi:pyridoxamine 5'-phosphate oxidase-domain-containing protein [Dioszegia hungarica]|uniref:Pyridoxamine 5'-phosphate oxidase-domain-containing protein n=1 Tax=Dioszegia hungarica TaxID=4972 RepID=A0AA38H5W0_9TREE|nr:pyridoxamine 5'-phosphate oxidase-domain-containing protein [Dioszegia hungarica]KAI9634795.1 pyridoxamine 5'-phosphate oxidase-domain-containing protein [Dioszegia hungarica]